MSYEWAEELALTVLGILLLVTGKLDEAQAPLLDALEIQERIGDYEGLGLSVGTLAEIAVARGEAESALELYDRSLEAFGRIGDRAEEARILSNVAGVLLARGDAEAAKERYCDSIRAYADIGSVRGVGLSLLGLAVVAALLGRPEASVAIAAAGDRYAREEGIVTVYSDDAPGFSLVDAARGALPPEALERAHARGIGLSIDDGVELSRSNR